MKKQIIKLEAEIDLSKEPVEWHFSVSLTTKELLEIVATVKSSATSTRTPNCLPNNKT